MQRSRAASCCSVLEGRGRHHDVRHSRRQLHSFLAKLDEYGMRFVNTRHEAGRGSHGRGRMPASTAGRRWPSAASARRGQHGVGVATAYAEGTPLIVLSGQRRRSIIYPERGGSFQNMDLLGCTSRHQVGRRRSRVAAPSGAHSPRLSRSHGRAVPGPSTWKSRGHPARHGRSGGCGDSTVAVRADSPRLGDA